LEISTLLLAVMLRCARLGACPIPAVSLKSCQLLAGERQDTENTSIVQIVGMIDARRNHLYS